tara:strand:- start:317 stop:2131 length:1815 start_codon:yes stop_codon:yes gene_type:complete
MSILKKLSFLLSVEERKRAVLIFCIAIILSIIELAGIASILPFMAILVDPEVIENNLKLNKVFQVSKNLGIENKNQFLLFSGLIVFLLLIISLLMKSLVTYLQINFSSGARYNIERRIIKGYLAQSYSWFLDRNSADLSKNILSEVNMVVQNGIRPMMDLLAKSVVAIMVISLLIAVDPKLALTVGLTLSSTYVIIYLLIRGYLRFLGDERLKIIRDRFSLVNEAFGAIKQIKISTLEKFYIDRFSSKAKNLTKYEALFSVLNQLPRFAIEAVVFGGMLLLVLYLMVKSSNFISVIPILALYTLAGYRLIPLLQAIYININTLRYIGPPLEALNKELLNVEILSPSEEEENKEILKLKKEITLKQINFKYSRESQFFLRDVNLNIPVGSFIGIVGSTGCGKTTLIDIILGLLETQDGKLEIDGKLIDKNNLRAWQRSIGYVPQQIYLSDDTIAANIAFGVDHDKINQEAVIDAAKISHLHDFIDNDLSLKYQTVVGERGVKLSGGQKQRIGIARALYHDPQILIMDEATNALDNLTEQTVMNSVLKLKKLKTIILITHRLSSVKNCDNIILIEKGKITYQGKFEQISQNSDFFKKVNDKSKIEK